MSDRLVVLVAITLLFRALIIFLIIDSAIDMRDTTIGNLFIRYIRFVMRFFLSDLRSSSSADSAPACERNEETESNRRFTFFESSLFGAVRLSLADWIGYK